MVHIGQAFDRNRPTKPRSHAWRHGGISGGRLSCTAMAWLGSLLRITLVVGASAVLYRFSWRSGARDAEAFGSLPGDDIMPHPMIEWTRATTIHATPDRIWPWLVQMGHGRAGWYTNERVDQLIWGVSARNADHILPEYQRLEVGDLIPDGPDHAATSTSAPSSPGARSCTTRSAIPARATRSTLPTARRSRHWNAVSSTEARTSSSHGHSSSSPMAGRVATHHPYAGRLRAEGDRASAGAPRLCRRLPRPHHAAVDQDPGRVHRLTTAWTPGVGACGLPTRLRDGERGAIRPGTPGCRRPRWRGGSRSHDRPLRLYPRRLPSPPTDAR